MLDTVLHPVRAWRTRQRIRQQLAAIRTASSAGLPLLWIGIQAAPLSHIA